MFVLPPKFEFLETFTVMLCFFELILSYIKISKIVNISTVIYFRMTLSITTVVESSAELTTGAFQFKIFGGNTIIWNRTQLLENS